MKFGKSKKQKKPDLQVDVKQEEFVAEQIGEVSADVETEPEAMGEQSSVGIEPEIMESVQSDDEKADWTEEAELMEETDSADEGTEQAVEADLAVEETEQTAEADCVGEMPDIEQQEAVESQTDAVIPADSEDTADTVPEDTVAMDVVAPVEAELQPNEVADVKKKNKKAAKPKKTKGDKKQKSSKPPKADKKQKENKKQTGKKRKGKVLFFQSIQIKLIAGFIIPVICIVALGTISYQKAADAVIEDYEESTVNLVNSIEGYLTLMTDTVLSRYKEYISNTDLSKYFRGLYDDDLEKKEEIRDYYSKSIKQYATGDKLVEDIKFVCDEHASIASSSVSDGAYAALCATENGQDMLADFRSYHWVGNNSEADTVLGTSSEFYALRLMRKFDNANAAMIIDISKDVVVEALDELNAGDGGYVAVVASDGAEIFSSATADETDTIFADKDFYNAAVEGQEMSGKSYVTFNGERYLFVYSRISGKGYAVCALVSEDYIMENVSGIKTITVAVVLFAAIIAFATGTVLARGISKAINSMIRSLKKVADGDFTVQVTTKRSDEFMLMAEAITDTVEHVKGLISNVQEVNTQLVEAAERVNESSSIFMETTQNINGSVDEIKTGAYKLDEDSDNCLAQMDKLSEKIETVTTNTEDIGKVVESTRESIISGIGSMEGVTESTESTTRITAHVIEAIEGLQDKSRSIGTIVGVINEIAEQTNLLSLNASIEAARAGDAGRGFAVVASEISKLADQSLKSADQIRKIIDEIISNTSNVVDIAKEAFVIVQAQDKSVNDTTEAFEDMKKNINTLLGSLQEITQNVVNMEGARVMTLESIENISSVSAETAACSLSVSETVEYQNKAIYGLDAAANTLTAKAEQLTELLSQFNV